MTARLNNLQFAVLIQAISSQLINKSNPQVHTYYYWMS